MQLKAANPSPRSVAVIGGGVIGAFVAYHLARRGRQVTIIEKGGFGRGSSWGNCGILPPSHLLPLNSAPNLLQGLRWLSKKDAPLRVRPRWDPALFSWLTGFASRCTRAARHRSALAIAAMMARAVGAYEALLAEEGIHCEWQRRGAIQLYQTRAAFRGRAKEDAEAKRYGNGCRPLDRETLMHLEPAAGPSLAGAWMDEGAAHLRPEALMTEMKRVLRQRGVSICEHTEVFRFRVEGGQAASAETSGGDIAADAFVVAAGAWTPLLSGVLGARIPIQPGKGYSVTLAGADRPLSRPCFFEEARSVATPWPSGLRLGGTMEFSGYDDRLDPVRIGALSAAARNYLAVGHLGRIEEEWYGWRPMTVDGVPIVDRLPKMRNAMVAAGHNMSGIAMAPATGRLVAEILSGEPPHIDPAPYRLDRFRLRRR